MSIQADTSQAEKELFPGQHTASAIKGQWEQASKMYGWLIMFEAFTGGNGDGDLSMEDQINLCRKDGKEIGSLTVKAVEQWTAEGWKELFDSR